jgi:uroporphyrinogen-III synthase
MKILVTRPKERIQSLKTKLIEKGHSVIAHPLLEIIPLEFDRFNAADYDGIIITSPFCTHLLEGANKVLAVGDIESDIKNVFYFENVKALRKHIKKNQKSQSYIYLRGLDVTDDLTDLVDSYRIVYQAKQVQFGDFKENFDAVLLFSKRSAQIFEQHIDEETSKNIDIFVLSSSIGNCLKLHYKKIHISTTPTLEGILRLL